MIVGYGSIGREAARLLDAFGVRSQQYAARATAEGRFHAEILPVLGADGELVSVDEGLRETTTESLAKLKPVMVS